MFLKQSTAAQTRLIGPFVDDTDFKSLETTLTINNSDVLLSKNGASAVAKNSGGATHVINGMYAVTFDAADTDTVGELAVVVKVAGALIVIARFFVVEEAVYDALYGASAAGPATKAQVIAALTTDTYGEPGQGAPPATASLLDKINYLYKAWRNKATQTSSLFSLYNDAGDTVDQKAAVADDGTTFTREKIGTGP
jgi:hypothetical protein